MAGGLASHRIPACNKEKSLRPRESLSEAQVAHVHGQSKGQGPVEQWGISGASWLFGKGIWLSACDQTTLGLGMSCLHRCRSDFRSHQKEQRATAMAPSRWSLVARVQGPLQCDLLQPYEEHRGHASSARPLEDSTGEGIVFVPSSSSPSPCPSPDNIL